MRNTLIGTFAGSLNELPGRFSINTLIDISVQLVAQDLPAFMRDAVYTLPSFLFIRPC